MAIPSVLFVVKGPELPMDFRVVVFVLSQLLLKFFRSFSISLSEPGRKVRCCGRNVVPWVAVLVIRGGQAIASVSKFVTSRRGEVTTSRPRGRRSGAKVNGVIAEAHAILAMTIFFLAIMTQGSFLSIDPYFFRKSISRFACGATASTHLATRDAMTPVFPIISWGHESQATRWQTLKNQELHGDVADGTVREEQQSSFEE